MVQDIFGIAGQVYEAAKIVHEYYSTVLDNDAVCKELAIKTEAVCGVAEFIQQNKQQLQAAKEFKQNSAKSLEQTIGAELAKTRDTVTTCQTYLDTYIQKQNQFILRRMLVAKKHQAKFGEFSDQLSAHLEQIAKHFSLLQIASIKAEMETLLVQVNMAITPKLEAIYTEVVRSSQSQEAKLERHRQLLDQQTALLMQILLKINNTSTLTMEELEVKAKECYKANDFVGARRYYSEAVEKGSARAMSALGAMLARGKGGPKEEARALELFTQSAAKLYRRGIFNLAQALFYGECGAQIDQTKALSLYLAAANSGYEEAGQEINKIVAHSEQVVEPGAQYLLSRALRDASAVGVQQDEKRAAELLRRAAAQAHKKSLVELPIAEGIVVGQNLLKKGNEQLAVECFLHLAGREGVTLQSELEALASQLKDATAQYHLAEAYDSGVLEFSSSELVNNLYSKAAEQGHAAAIQRLAKSKPVTTSATLPIKSPRRGSGLFDEGITSSGPGVVVTSPTAQSTLDR